MALITSVEYDDCRKWMKKKRNRKVAWDEIRLACKENKSELADFLKCRIDEDDWPADLNVEIWESLVDDLENAEKNKIQIQKACRMAELHDGQQENNRVIVPECEESSWQLYKTHLKEKKHFSDEAIQKIEDASIGILKRLSTDTEPDRPIKGLVIGNVQSGKTANMAALMAMAADWHWNMFIVLSGTIESLRKQTQSRLHGDLNHPGNLTWIQFDHLSKKKSPVGQRLCDLQLEPDSRMRYMTVCLKMKSRLEDLIDWIEADQTNIKNLRVLVIDDEADQAGINTGDVYTDAERKTINRLILNLVHCRNKKAVNSATNTYGSHYQAMNYISYTATPYANCLNEIGPETLYPKNFIRTLEITRSYFGPSRFFSGTDADDDQHLNIVRTVPLEDVSLISNIHNKGIGALPESLKDSIKWFLCVVAVMRFYDYKKPVSMLVHTSQKQIHHQAVADAIKEWLLNNHNEIVHECESIYETEIKRFTKEILRSHYPDYEHPDSEIWDYPVFADIKDNIDELLCDVKSIMMGDDGDLQYFRQIHLCIDNCANNKPTDDGMHMRLTYPDEKSPHYPDYATAFIVIGGNTLSRGLTLDGLVSTFFLRSVKQADTLMQMGRWFGYRPQYELFQRVWLTEDTIRKFELLTDIDSDLREQIYQMQLIPGKGPEDFNLALLTSPKAKWMSLTSKNKMHMATAAEVDFSGMDTQLTVYSKKKSDQEQNISVAESFILSLGSGYRKSDYTTAYIWEDIPFKKIADDFFGGGFLVPETSLAFQDIGLLTDPTCGSGSLLIKSAKQARSKQISIYGQEVNGSSVAMAKMNMYIHEISDAKIAWGDTLANPMFKDDDGNLLTFDAIVANMPFSKDKWATGFNPGGESSGKGKREFKMEATLDKYHRFDWGVPPASKGDWAFLLHMIASLAVGGRIAAVAPHGVLFRGAAEGRIRQRVVDENLLDAVIGLPENLFYGTSIPACILVFKKGRQNTDVCFIDASKKDENGNLRYVKASNQNELGTKNVEDIISAYQKRVDVDKFVHVATRDEIIQNDYNLNIPRYVDTFEEEELVDIDEVQQNIARLKVDIAEAEKQMDAYLKELGL